VVLNPSVSKDRTVIQYHHMDEAVQQMLDTGLATGVVSMGTLNHGGRAYVTLEMGETIDIPGYSLIKLYFSLTDSHDGRISASGRGTMEAIVCENTFSANTVGVPALWSIRHTKNAEQYIQQAVAGFIASALQQKEIAAAVDQLINSVYTEADFYRLTKYLFPYPLWETSDASRMKGARTICKRNREGLEARYWGSDIESCRDTRWGALMAVQGFDQHEIRLPKKTDRKARHLDRVLFGKADLTQRASARLLSV